MSVTARRYYLDQALEDCTKYFKGTVIELGGRKINRRGRFIPPVEKVERWITLDINLLLQPDIVSMLPEIPLKNDIADVVLMSETLEYIYEQQCVRNEIARILKNGGILIVTVPFLCAHHADFEHDYYRLTGSAFERWAKEKFDILEFSPMGGMFAVCYDLIRTYLVNKNEISLVQKIFRRIIVSLRPVALYLDKCFFKNRKYINTGYFLVCQKNH